MILERFILFLIEIARESYDNVAVANDYHLLKCDKNKYGVEERIFDSTTRIPMTLPPTITIC